VSPQGLYAYVSTAFPEASEVLVMDPRPSLWYVSYEPIPEEADRLVHAGAVGVAGDAAAVPSSFACGRRERM